MTLGSLPTGLSVDLLETFNLRDDVQRYGGVVSQAGHLFTVGNLLNWPPQTTCHRYVLYKLTFDLCSHTTSHFYHTHNTAVWYTGGKCTQTSIPFIYVPGPEI